MKTNIEKLTMKTQFYIERAQQYTEKTKNSLTFLGQTDFFIKRHHLQVNLLKTIIDNNNKKIAKLSRLVSTIKKTYSDTCFKIKLDIKELLEINEEIKCEIENIKNFYILGFNLLREKIISSNNYHRLYEDNSIEDYSRICKSVWQLNFFKKVYLDSSFFCGINDFIINLLKNKT
ncbi:hypothetical protein [Candidatus Phytoplasma solani]|uniref:hypothetical protein n=1 Tax=Candidatus Phytoplasma solani TaxID=69896 RepID=UPI00358E2F73